MPPRSDRASSAFVELSRDERAILDRMKVLAGVATDPNLLRIALWSLADHYDLEMPSGVFDLRESSGHWTRTKRNPRIRQHEPYQAAVGGPAVSPRPPR